MADTLLALYFKAPLQSWGHQSKFDRRTTLSYPTRSGVLGLLCAAMGIDHNDREGLARLESIGMTVFVLKAGSRLTDYHTVGGGYDKKKDSNKIPLTAEAKGRRTALTYREYLQDAVFGVVLYGPAALLQEICTALEDPRWGTWLGRKSCIPTARVCEGLFDSEEDALSHLKALAGIGDVERIRSIREVKSFEDGTDAIMDKPLDFAERRFGIRQVLDAFEE